MADPVREALRRLANEVGGLRAFEGAMREVAGNTNWAILMRALAEADSAIAAPVRDIQPVAWAMFHKGQRTRITEDREEAEHYAKHPDFTVTPLYTAPPASPTGAAATTQGGTEEGARSFAIRARTDYYEGQGEREGRVRPNTSTPAAQQEARDQCAIGGHVWYGVSASLARCKRCGVAAERGEAGK